MGFQIIAFECISAVTVIHTFFPDCEHGNNTAVVYLVLQQYRMPLEPLLRCKRDRP